MFHKKYENYCKEIIRKQKEFLKIKSQKQNMNALDQIDNYLIFKF